MMQRQPNHAVNILPVPDVAGHGQRSLVVPYPYSRRIHTARIA
jgi:hypothetical protein